MELFLFSRLQLNLPLWISGRFSLVHVHVNDTINSLFARSLGNLIFFCTLGFRFLAVD